MSKAGTKSTGASAERGLTSHRQDATGDDFAAAAIAVDAIAVATVLSICEKKICLF